jgi:hypothetical protein
MMPAQNRNVPVRAPSLSWISVPQSIGCRRDGQKTQLGRARPGTVQRRAEARARTEIAERASIEARNFFGRRAAGAALLDQLELVESGHRASIAAGAAGGQKHHDRWIGSIGAWCGCYQA